MGHYEEATQTRSDVQNADEIVQEYNEIYSSS
jgi:hypothetical protein